MKHASRFCTFTILAGVAAAVHIYPAAPSVSTAWCAASHSSKVHPSFGVAIPPQFLPLFLAHLDHDSPTAAPPWSCENKPPYVGSCPNFYGCKKKPPCSCLGYCKKKLGVLPAHATGGSSIHATALVAT